MNTVTKQRQSRAGMSLVEIITVIGVLGVIVSLVLPNWGETFKGSRGVVAKEILATLNLSLKEHEQVNYKFKLAADADSADDELAIVRSLQFRDPLDPAPGSPFVACKLASGRKFK